MGATSAAAGRPARHEEAARRVAPALDQQPAQAALAQDGDDAGRGELPEGFGQAEDSRLVGDGFLALAAAAAQDQRRRGAVVQQRTCRRQPAVGVDDDPDRVRPLDVAGGQARLVEGRGARPDDHRVAERAGPVQVDQRGAAADVARVARAGGDEAVQIWPRMATLKPASRGVTA